MQSPLTDSTAQDDLFRRWLKEYAGIIYKVIHSCAGSADDREDLFQEILIQLWRSMPAFRGEAKETTWIYRVAFNTTLAWQRVEKRRRVHWMKMEEFYSLGQSEVGGVSVAERELIEQLYAAIRNLPKVDASLALMLIDGLSYEEMADVLGISQNYIGVKLTRIRKQLAVEMKGVINDL